MQPKVEGRKEIGPEDNVVAELVSLVESGRQLVRILSDELHPGHFDNTELSDALSALARRNRHCEVRILIKDAELLVKRSHHLSALHRRLPSLVQVRKLSYCPELYVANYLLVDDHGLYYDPRDDDKVCFVNDDDRPLVKHLQTQFDELWAKSQAEPELRNIGI